jgi:hypothetical protein
MTITFDLRGEAELKRAAAIGGAVLGFQADAGAGMSRGGGDDERGEERGNAGLA